MSPEWGDWSDDPLYTELYHGATSRSPAKLLFVAVRTQTIEKNH